MLLKAYHQNPLRLQESEWVLHRWSISTTKIADAEFFLVWHLQSWAKLRRFSLLLAETASKGLWARTSQRSIKCQMQSVDSKVTIKTEASATKSQMQVKIKKVRYSRLCLTTISSPVKSWLENSIFILLLTTNLFNWTGSWALVPRNAHIRPNSSVL